MLLLLHVLLYSGALRPDVHTVLITDLILFEEKFISRQLSNGDLGMVVIIKSLST